MEFVISNPYARRATFTAFYFVERKQLFSDGASAVRRHEIRRRQSVPIYYVVFVFLPKTSCGPRVVITDSEHRTLLIACCATFNVARPNTIYISCNITTQPRIVRITRGANIVENISFAAIATRSRTPSDVASALRGAGTAFYFGRYSDDNTLINCKL